MHQREMLGLGHTILAAGNITSLHYRVMNLD